ncbi:MAG TPA: VOC family protein [Cytophagaceae bacterium]
MTTNIFVNLPVKDLKRSMEFFAQLGYSFNMQFTDEKATCMVISDQIYAMLITEEYFKTFIKKEICDTTKSTEVLVALSVESKDKVNEIVDKAIKAGGKVVNEQDLGFMFFRSYEDLDGHTWEYFYMDPSAAQG